MHPKPDCNHSSLIKLKDEVLTSVSAFPNVSVDLKRVVARLLTVIGQMSFAFKAMGSHFDGRPWWFTLCQPSSSIAYTRCCASQDFGNGARSDCRMLLFEFGSLLYFTVLGSVGGIALSFVFSHHVDALGKSMSSS